VLLSFPEVRLFLGDLFGWEVASEGAYPGYTFIDSFADAQGHRIGVASS
jgi:hypothetical protein